MHHWYRFQRARCAGDHGAFTVGGAALHYVKSGCAAIGGEPGVPQDAKAEGDPGRGDEVVVDACLLGAVALPESRDRHARGVNRAALIFSDKH